MARTQSDAKLSGSEAAAFTTFVKDKALKILDDYSLATGRKWQAIRNEIFETLGIEETENAPLLTRQDLESWAARRSVLGDQKFRLVFDFLTHPETMARPQFARAGDLLDFGMVDRIGGTFAEFFDDHENSGYVRAAPFPEPMDDATIESRFQGYEGCFVGSLQENDYCLSLERFRDKPFFVCHLFSWPREGAGELTDWNIDRYSGFATVGSLFRLHTKGLTLYICRDMYLVPAVERDGAEVTTIHVLWHSLVPKALENVIFQNLKYAQKRLSFVDPLQHLITMDRTTDESLYEFIDQFRWNIVI